MRFLCRIGWHKWGKWESMDVDVVNRFMGYEKRRIAGQVTFCTHCNRRKMKV